MNYPFGYQPTGFNPYGQFQPQQPPQHIPYTQPIQTQPQTAPQGLHGRLVNGVQDITINDLPSDGSMGVFPAADGSAIYVRSWNGDGTTRTTEYRPVGADDNAATIDPLAQIMNTLSDIQDTVNALQGELKPKPTRRKAATDES